MATTTTVTPTSVTCPPHQESCADQLTCVPIDRFCDGVVDCPDTSDEDTARCATTCDGQFVLRGPSGSFSSSVYSETYNSSIVCRWVIRVDPGLSVQISFHHFETEENIDILRMYEGVGAARQLRAELSGFTPPGTVWLLSDQSTVEFISNDVNNLYGFNATYSTANTSNLSDPQILTCTFEQGMCFWRQQQDQHDAYWIRTRGPSFPPLTGPSVDHTIGNISGFYIVTPMSPGEWLKSFRIYSLPLTPTTQLMCLSFWYHMFGNDVHRLRVLLIPLSQPESSDTMVFQKDGNYGDNWNYGQVNLNLTTEARVVFEALNKGGLRNKIALDDIVLTAAPCSHAPPEPTNVPPPTTTPPIPSLWTLHAVEGKNIQLHFLDFDVEAAYDVVEVRDGAGSNSTLLAVLTGNDGPSHDLFSTTNQMTVWFFTDPSGYGRGFRANFTSGVDLGTPVVYQVNSSSRLQFQLISTLYTVCADTWLPHLSDFTCQYLGYSETCHSEKVISLACDNQQTVQTVCLPPEGQDITAGEKCFIAGWGRLAEEGSLPDVLQEADVPLLGQEQCQLQLPEYDITSSMCSGDGAPH
ncbi:hypothetical protein INR49_004621 [Caranx melampygus]|nr:hypothetical protein INR49_004621 [Caranx melampygus]